MKTLEEHNEEMQRVITNHNKIGGNEIICPSCGEELFDRKGFDLLCDPPKTQVYCKKCNFVGSRY